MPATEPTSSSTSPDKGIPAACPVEWADAIAKAVVKAADPARWWPLWRALEQGIDEAREAARTTGDAYPWEDPGEVSHIAWKDFQRTLETAIGGCIPGIPERVRLVEAASKVYEELTAKGSSGKAIRSTRYGVRVCARPGCGKRFGARSHRHAYCSGACRVGAYEARQRANGMAAANVREGAAQPVSPVPGA